MAMGSVVQLGLSNEEQRYCMKCNKDFDKPKLVQYYACPHCLSKLDENQKAGCQYWFGYLNQKERNETIPPQCVECANAVECMLSQHYSSRTAVNEIKKWY